ncbi:MAG: putative undecaprenyl-phosphate N-acetylglucosaminyl 1-phosphate transferase [Smithella sp. PtaU1.Bin162]|nr:MAG: putative undecaprenyl-phosphate N-acetylglucosaminyl 1-phosphate transferase [Smithella sp. PtaU1.Bin162]
MTPTKLVLASFSASLLMALLLTPLARSFGIRFGFLDIPKERKIHSMPLPRSGGLAIFISSIAAVSLTVALAPPEQTFFYNQQRAIFFSLGMLASFGTGLFDDFKRLNYRIKFLMQILAATVAFYGGIRIDELMGLHLNIAFSYPITVFWFLLFVNAVNLIDGLDGLAAGICFLASLVMIFFCVSGQSFAFASAFAALAGGLLGFLRYNFNPAKIFMGDSGSYFLGYTIAGLTILTSAKNEIGAIMLMPLLALGVPVFDTLLSPIRRWMLGKAMFRPDDGHIHHQLIRRIGLSTRKAVMILYGVSMVLCILCIVLIQIRDQKIGVVFIVVGIATAFLVRKLGYFEYITYDKFYGWLRDVTDVAGINPDRRSFLSLQVEVSRSNSLDDLWENVCMILDRLKFMKGEFHLSESPSGINSKTTGNCENRLEYQKNPENRNGSKRRHISRDDAIHYAWTCRDIDSKQDTASRNLFKVELPLLNDGKAYHGKLVLIKDLKSDPLTPYTLRRLEYLRQSMSGALEKMLRESAWKLSTYETPAASRTAPRKVALH